jgi:predicted nucleic acid-binding protein
MDPMMVLESRRVHRSLSGTGDRATYIQRLPSDRRATTDITVMELDKGAADQQELATIVTRLPVSTTASRRAVELVHQYGLAHGLGIPDALIAAIALEGAHTLVTDNVRHFRFIPGLNILRAPYRHPHPPPLRGLVPFQ